ncbi:MAG: biosynthetic arginine decarboxylase [Candidatus Tectimicrobiota bacterium]|nr:MAG: biosynthetic arginine decarboxylase [Candidatus Tectomicrobia bacterium]
MQRKGGRLPKRWSIADAIETYGIREWGNHYFQISEAGHVLVTPPGEGGTIDLKALVDELRQRGVEPPILFRFSDILRSRIDELNQAFRKAIKTYGYPGVYRGVYPIKVNQERQVVEEIVRFGRPYHHGLEAGSKPELLAVLAMLDDPEALIICNGYKDAEYVETALLGSKLGRTVILVVEKPSELPLIARLAQQTGVRPRLGVRAKLATRGSGRWEASGGDHAKFGLTAREMLEAVQFLCQHRLLDTFELLHFHLGSQISNIRNIKEGLREAGRLYCELVKLGAPLRYFDVGGGLGVDYDGSQTNFASSMNYTLQEYANDVVYAVLEMCDAAGIKPPTLVSESGRATVAHHCVLVVDVLGTSEFRAPATLQAPPEEAQAVVWNLYDTYRELTRKNLLEAYHDAVQYKDESLTLFALGHLSLHERALAEEYFWGICHKILRFTREMAEVPEELEDLERLLADTYFCNFSIFQSLPDAWAINQLFPIMPIHRLHEEPTRRAVLADITCDSDGKIDAFIDRRDVKHVLPLHPLNGDHYYLGIFLVGAYQEILGDLHNLFGDTNTVHVALAPEGGYRLERVVAGDTVADVLRYVSYSREDLVARIHEASRRALKARQLTLHEARAFLKLYETGLSGYTYLQHR